MLEPPVICTICLELPIDVVTTPCGHNFCQLCIRDWSNRSSKCPDCNGNLPSQALKVNTGLRDLLALWRTGSGFRRSDKTDGCPGVDIKSTDTLSEEPMLFPMAITRVPNMQTPLFTCGNNHPLVISAFRGGGYREGWICNNCRGRGNGSRWCCHSCQADICFSCHPQDQSAAQPSVARSLSQEANEFDRPFCKRMIHLMTTSDFSGDLYGRGWTCSICNRTGSTQHWYCRSCHEDICYDCKPRYSNRGGIRHSSTPLCQSRGHRMVQSAYAERAYVNGWICGKCHVISRGERWYCGECSEDYCFNCKSPVVVDNDVDVDVGELPEIDYNSSECKLLCSNEAHVMRVSSFAEDDYRGGWICGLCETPSTGFRWFCEECSEDFCFDCRPNTTSIYISKHFHCSTGMHEMLISAYNGGSYKNGWCCDICRRHGRGERWFCKYCNSDYCFECRSKPSIVTTIH